MTGRKKLLRVPWVGQGPGPRFVQAARSWVAAPHSWSRAEPAGRNSGGSYRQAGQLSEANRAWGVARGWRPEGLKLGNQPIRARTEHPQVPTQAPLWDRYPVLTDPMILLGKHTAWDLATFELDPKSCRRAGRREKLAEGGGVREGSSGWPGRIGRISHGKSLRDTK